MAPRLSRGESWLYFFAAPDKLRPVLVLSRQKAIGLHLAQPFGCSLLARQAGADPHERLRPWPRIRLESAPDLGQTLIDALALLRHLLAQRAQHRHRVVDRVAVIWALEPREQELDRRELTTAIGERPQARRCALAYRGVGVTEQRDLLRQVRLRRFLRSGDAKRTRGEPDFKLP